jgi:hypothetical protein
MVAREDGAVEIGILVIIVMSIVTLGLVIWAVNKLRRL